MAISGSGDAVLPLLPNYVQCRTASASVLRGVARLRSTQAIDPLHNRGLNIMAVELNRCAVVRDVTAGVIIHDCSILRL
jgi:hypothetical protein